MNLVINTFTLLFITIIIGKKLAQIRVRGSSLGPAMILLTGILVSYLAGSYIHSLPETHGYYEEFVALMEASIVPNNILTLFHMLFISGTGLLASKQLLFVLKEYGAKFVAMSVLITTLGFMGTCAATAILEGHSAYEMSGVFTGALSSTPGLMAGLSTSETNAGREITEFDTLSPYKQRWIIRVVGEPTANGFSEVQKKKYIEKAIVGTGMGYTVTYPFGNLLVIVALNALPFLFNIDVRKEREICELQFRKMNGNSLKGRQFAEPCQDPKTFNMIAYFLVLLIGYVVGLVKIGSFSLSAIGGVLISSLVLGSIGRIRGICFDFDAVYLVNLRDIGMAGGMAAVGLRLGYPVSQSITGSQAMLPVYATVIGLIPIFVGFLIGRYCFKMNWMMLSGALCGGMTNTSGLGVVVDATNCEYPSISYAATYPFSIVMMVVYTILIQRLSF